jgi:hypothetical protein
MSILNFLKKLFPTAQNTNIITIYLRDKKCKERIKVLARKSYDIHTLYEEEGEAAYRLSKVVVCNNCYNKIYLTLDFDRNYNIIKEEVKGGDIISEEEYNKEENGSD